MSIVSTCSWNRHPCHRINPMTFKDLPGAKAHVGPGMAHRCEHVPWIEEGVTPCLPSRLTNMWTTDGESPGK